MNSGGGALCTAANPSPTMRYVIVTLATLIVCIAAAAAADTPARAQSPAGQVQLMAVDADTAGNSPNALGPTNVCAEVPVGQARDIDVVVRGVPPLTDNAGGIAGFEFRLYYNPAFMKITAVNVVNQMLGANPDSSVIDTFIDPVPNDSGRFLVAAFDFGADRGESGDGVLARITVEGVAAGTTTLLLSPSPGPVGEDSRINDSAGTEYVIEGIESGLLAVGESCNPAATPPPAATPAVTAAPPGTTGEPGETGNPSGTDNPDETRSPDESPGGEDESGSPTGSPGESPDDNGQGGEDNGNEDDDGGSNALLFILLGLGAAAIVAGVAFFVINRRRGAGGEPPVASDPVGAPPPDDADTPNMATPPPPADEPPADQPPADTP